MPQYLVAIHHPDNYDSSIEGEAMQRDIHALNRRDDRCRGQDFRWRPLRGQQREVAARAARWQGPHHRRAVPRDQGAHRRFLDTESR